MDLGEGDAAAGNVVGRHVRYSALQARLNSKVERDLIGLCMETGMRCVSRGWGDLYLVVSNDSRLCEVGDRVRQYVATHLQDYVVYLAMNESVEEDHYFADGLFTRCWYDVGDLDRYIADFGKTGITYGLSIEPRASPSGAC